MRYRTVLIAIALASAIGVVASGAAERAPAKAVGSTSLKPPPAIDTEAMNAMLRADRDKDGTLSHEELEQYDLTLARRFADADGDKDGKLTFYEFEKLFGEGKTARAAAALKP
jgi:EF hand domain-containing protein